jgi:pimeloyl-ACP methyl ester carboxylesterase
VIQGDHDYLDPGAAQWDRLRHDHPSVDVTVIPRAGHNAWIDDPHAFDQALAAALAHQPSG